MIGMASLVTDRLATITPVGQGDTSVSALPIRPLGWSSRGELTAFLTVLTTNSWGSLTKSTGGDHGRETNGASHDVGRRGMKLNFDTSVCLLLVVL